MSEGRDPEEVRELLTRHFDSARVIIDRYGGTVEKFIGDAVMAVWGAPVAHEDDAERAVRAGLELVDAVTTLAPGLAARAAVLTGEAAVTLGAHGQGMVAGDLVNTASRLQGVAPVGGVLVGEATMRATDRSIAYEQAGEQVLKGKRTPVPAWRALRVVAEVGGRNRQDGLEAPFVGREAELRLLKELLAATGRERRARLVSVTGQAGIGKSRLAWEFSKWLDGIVEPVYWHAGRSPAYGEGVTFWALAEMVRGRCRLTEHDDPGTVRERVADTVRTWVPDAQEARRIGPALLTLLGVEAPAMAHEELFAAWRTFFERIALEGTVMLVFEDLQWADPGLLDFIDHVLEWSSGVPIMILTLARPELLDRRPAWGAGRRNFVALHLDPLAPETMRELLLGLVPGLPEAAVRSVVARADGVPLYAVEIVRTLVAEGRLVEADGVYRPTDEIGELTVPATLQALIGARLDGLDPADRQLLQDAAVLGHTFTVGSLSAVSGVSPEALEPRLRGLVRRELLTEEVDPRSPERGQFGFVQALIREVAYGTTTMADRRAKHLGAARHFEGLGEEAMAGALAAHYVAAYRSSAAGPERDALAAQARLALRGAAERATRLGSNDHALGFLRQALEVASDERERAALLQVIGETATFAGHHQEAIVALRESLERFEALEDEHGALGARGTLGEVYLNARDPEAARLLLEPIEATFDERQDDPIEVRAAAQVPRLFMFLGTERARALAFADRVMTAAQPLGLDDVIADTLVTKGAITGDAGRRHEGIALIRGGMDLATRLGAPLTALRGAINLGTRLGLRDGFRIATDGYAEAKRLGLRSLSGLLLGNAANVALESGDWAWATGELRAHVGAVEEASDRVYLLIGLLWFEVLRGEPQAETTHAEIGSILATQDPSPEQRSNRADSDLAMAMSQGRYADAIRSALVVAEVDALNTEYAITWAARAAALGGDREALAQMAARLAGFGPSAPVASAAAIHARADLDAVDGRPADAMLAYRDAIRRWRDEGSRLGVALCGLGASLRLDPADPDVRSAVEEARGILEELDARLLLGILDAAAVDRQVPGRSAARQSSSDAASRPTAPSVG